MNKLNLQNTVATPWPDPVERARAFLIQESNGDLIVCIRGDKEVLLFREERTTYCAFDQWFRSNYQFVRYLTKKESVEVKGTPE